jgi:hypothetical protein
VLVFEVRRENAGQVFGCGAYLTMAEAEAALGEFVRRVERVGGRNDRYWIEQVDTTGLFEVPPLPKPRDRFSTRVTNTSEPGRWAKVHVEVLEQDRVIAEYDRNHAMLQTFEPFRQGERHYALISPDYTATSVMDLTTGEVVAAEEPNTFGFCPVGFYVPDWHDVHGQGHSYPGTLTWRSDYEWLTGDFGFVWGCIWGDDSSWKVEYLDLSGIREGHLRRDDRFGYIKLATNPDVEARNFIRVERWQGRRQVEFAVWESYDLQTGAVRPVRDPWDFDEDEDDES